MARILIVGGYGAFGARLATLLAREPGLEIVLAGRDERKATSAACELAATAKANISAAAIDLTALDGQVLRQKFSPAIVINTAGPFQDFDYALARAAIGAGSHYIDIADSRAYVTGIGALDEEARAAGVLVISGASTVPGLTSAAVAAHASRFSELRSIQIGISPGNSFDPGHATVVSVLKSIGRPLVTRDHGRPQRSFGWQGIERAAFPGLGRRWLGHVDVPDLDLLPQHFPGLEHVSVKAGAEVGVMHLSLWALSWLVRINVVSRPERLAGPLLSLKRRLGLLGSDRGGLFVRLDGRGPDGAPLSVTWSLTAGSSHGPFVPVLAAAALVKGLVKCSLEARGATPCFALMPLDTVLVEARGLDIGWSVKEI